LILTGKERWERSVNITLNRHTGDKMLRKKLVDPPIKFQIALSYLSTAKYIKFIRKIIRVISTKIKGYLILVF
jgi:hypothetical protein